MFHTWPNSLTVSEVFSQILATCNNCRTFRRVSVISWSGWCQCKALQQCETRSFLGRSLEKRLGLIGGPELEHLELFAELLCFPGALSFQVKSWRRSRCFCGGPPDANIHFRMHWTQWWFHAANVRATLHPLNDARLWRLVLSGFGVVMCC